MKRTFRILIACLYLGGISCGSTAEVPLQDPLSKAKDLFGKVIESPSALVHLRLLLFFSKKHSSLFENFKKEIYDQIYDNPQIQILLVLQKTGVNLMMKKKLKKELQKEFENENECRKNRLKELFPSLDAPPGLQFITDLDGKFSASLKISPSLSKPLALFLDTQGSVLHSFSSEEIAECINWISVTMKSPPYRENAIHGKDLRTSASGN
jgi:hypothetical protein